MIRTLLLCGLMFFVGTGLATAAGKDQKAIKGKKGAQTIHGVVENVTTKAGKNVGTITVKVHAKNKRGAPGSTATSERTVKVTPATKFFLVRGKKGSVEATPATFADLKAGARIAVVAHAGKGHQAERVLIHAGKKKKS